MNFIKKISFMVFSLCAISQIQAMDPNKMGPGKKDKREKSQEITHFKGDIKGQPKQLMYPPKVSAGKGETFDYKPRKQGSSRSSNSSSLLRSSGKQDSSDESSPVISKKVEKKEDYDVMLAVGIQVKKSVYDEKIKQLEELLQTNQSEHYNAGYSLILSAYTECYKKHMLLAIYPPVNFKGFQINPNQNKDYKQVWKEVLAEKGLISQNGTVTPEVNAIILSRYGFLNGILERNPNSYLE